MSKGICCIYFVRETTQNTRDFTISGSALRLEPHSHAALRRNMARNYFLSTNAALPDRPWYGYQRGINRNKEKLKRNELSSINFLIPTRATVENSPINKPVIAEHS